MLISARSGFDTPDTGKRLTMVNTRVLRILAWSPMLSTINSTKPLHDTRDPIEKDSGHTSRFNRAAQAQPMNLVVKATRVTAVRYPQVTPLSSMPRLVLSPERVK